MPSTVKWILGIFGLLILISIIGGKDSIPIIAPLIIIIFPLWLYFSYRSAKISKSTVMEAAQRYNSFISQLEESRELPNISVDIDTHPGEFVVMMADSAIYEQKSTGRRGMYAGTRVKIGKIPIYLGGGQSVSNQAVVKTSDGQLYMTNKRIVFVGMKRSWDCKHSDVLSIENGLDRLVVNSRHSDKPIIFDVQNGFYWEGLNKLFAQVRIDTPRLPDHVHLVEGRIERDISPIAKGIA